MSARKDLPGRLLRLLALLQSRREWSGSELAERLGVTDRTVRRDVERLRSLDYPVTGTTGSAGGYRLASGKNVPPLVLDDDEAVAVAIGLTSAAVGGVAGIEASSMSVLAKLERILPARLRPSVAAVGAAEVVGQDEAPRVDPGLLAVLAACCRDLEIVAFGYESRRGEGSRRRVEPHRLVMVQARWYLLAFDPERADWRTFRVDRVSELAPTRHHFTARPLPADDAASYLVESFAEAEYRHTVRLAVQLPAAVVRENFFGSVVGTISAVSESACEVRLSAESPALLTQYVAGIVALGADFTLEATPATTELLRSTGRRLAEI
ncbi:helix-turn-helix transcriptional regulator [Kribbella catacumbae]|uniref:helix-turn-helix transcriptional regulator n=1 Tax=Kribbella catacumbae TaxID=460086 RepID=UPI000364ABA7|nr:WYL domain-containing protein [Kribbella catacumbae]